MLGITAFQDLAPNWVVLATKVIVDYSLILDDPPPNNRRNPSPLQINLNKLWAFFDGAAQERGCGGGAILHLSHQHSYNPQMYKQLS